jgi:hypothetical protein
MKCADRDLLYRLLVCRRDELERLLSKKTFAAQVGRVFAGWGD